MTILDKNYALKGNYHYKSEKNLSICPMILIKGTRSQAQVDEDADNNNEDIPEGSVRKPSYVK